MGFFFCLPVYTSVKWIVKDDFCYHMTFNSKECEIYVGSGGLLSLIISSIHAKVKPLLQMRLSLWLTPEVQFCLVFLLSWLEWCLTVSAESLSSALISSGEPSLAESGEVPSTWKHSIATRFFLCLKMHKPTLIRRKTDFFFLFKTS